MIGYRYIISRWIGLDGNRYRVSAADMALKKRMAGTVWLLALTPLKHLGSRLGR
jgi:hypothetical protein